MPVHPEIEQCAEYDKPERQKLAGQPEMDRQVEESHLLQENLRIIDLQKIYKDLETKYGKQPARQHKPDYANLTAHGPASRFEDVNSGALVMIRHGTLLPAIRYGNERNKSASPRP